MSEARKSTYDKQLNERLPERLNDMVDLQVKLVCSEQRTPATEDGVCNLEDTDIDPGIR